MIFIKFFILFLLSISLYSKEMYFDTISLSKIKKVIKKEEKIAKAYKKYIMAKALKPTSILGSENTSLKAYLPDGFDNTNLFGGSISLDDTKTYIVSSIPSNVKSALYDKYYSNENRVYSKAPLSKKNHNVSIVFSTKEKYISDNTSLISTDNSTTVKSKYLLDEKGVLHWYDDEGNLLYSFDEKLIVYPSSNMIDNGSISDEFKKTLNDANTVLSPGQQIFNIEDEVAQEYINIGGEIGIIKIGDTSRDIGETIIQFSRRAGGMIVNGDIYTWGNNANQIVGLGSNSFTGSTGSYRYPVITGLIRAKAKTYNSDIDDKNYFSSPLRPKFVDFFSTVYHSTCGVTVEGVVYCGGLNGVNISFGNNFTHVVNSDGKLVDSKDPEMLYKSRFFDGSTTDKSAKKMFANNQLWLILSKNGDIYRWGYDHGSGFSGNGDDTFNYRRYRIQNTNKDPEKLNISNNGKSVNFTDITYLLTIGYRKMGALSQDGDIYIWGIEDEIASGKCSVKWEDSRMNLCEPLKIETDIVFKSISGGLEAFLAVSTDNKFYKIHQPKDKKPIVLSIEDEIKNSEQYIAEDDIEILSVDFSTKLGQDVNTGIVWVNGKNELKGDYFTSDNVNDDFFKDAISKIKWKKIKVIEDDNGMCGIDIYNQMYCWGKMSFYRTGSSYSDFMGNTFMLPVFNTNLYDLDKDYLLAEGGYSGYLTKMTSGDWNPSNNDFFMKYPTYIGGFNYEFIFK